MWPYYLGCPVWSNKTWVGELFTATAKNDDFLPQYASVFNTVEGNTTFYGLPTRETVARWRNVTPAHFHFCFKFPRTITHVKKLVGAEMETELMFELLAPLESRLGPFLLQLPPSFALSDLESLAGYLATLPTNYYYAVEVRQRDFFDEGVGEQALAELLNHYKVGRAHFDTRALRAAPASHNSHTAEAQRKKPNLPTRFTVTGDLPMIRFVAHPDLAANSPYLQEYVPIVLGWIQAGLSPYFFVHAPDDFYAPRLGRHFHSLLQTSAREAGIVIEDMAVWPADVEGKASEPPQQLTLF